MTNYSHKCVLQSSLNLAHLKGLLKHISVLILEEICDQIHTVMTNYSHKIRSNFFHAYMVNCFEESVENWHVVRVTIVVVPFVWLKEIKIKTSQLQHKKSTVLVVTSTRQTSYRKSVYR